VKNEAHPSDWRSGEKTEQMPHIKSDLKIEGKSSGSI